MLLGYTKGSHLGLSSAQNMVHRNRGSFERTCLKGIAAKTLYIHEQHSQVSEKKTKTKINAKKGKKNIS